jgi:hypothetical protein
LSPKVHVPVARSRSQSFVRNFAKPFSESIEGKAISDPHKGADWKENGEFHLTRKIESWSQQT